jgi:hypothetical protein
MDEGHTVLINAFAMICEAMLVSKAFGFSLRLTDLGALTFSKLQVLSFDPPKR